MERGVNNNWLPVQTFRPEGAKEPRSIDVVAPDAQDPVLPPKESKEDEGGGYGGKADEENGGVGLLHRREGRLVAEDLHHCQRPVRHCRPVDAAQNGTTEKVGRGDVEQSVHELQDEDVCL